MRLDNIKMRNKLLIPVVATGLIILTLVSFAATRLTSISSEADQIITKRDLAATVLVRVARKLTSAETNAYAALSNDSGSEAGKRAIQNYPLALRGAAQDLDLAVTLVPDRTDTINAFKARVAQIDPVLTEAYKIGASTPGLEHGSDLTPQDLAEMGRGAKLLGQAGLQLDKLIDDLVLFNSALLNENAARSAELKTKSSQSLWALWGGGIGSILIGFAFSTWLSSSKVARPILRITDNMERLAGGDVTVEVDGRERGDEIGAMAKAVQVFKDNAVEKIRLEKEAQAARAAAEAEKTRLDAVKAEEARKQAHVVEAIAQGLDYLAHGKLTHRLNEAFPAEYERLRNDFNGAMERLQATVSVVANNTMALRSGTKDISTASDDLARRTEQQAANLEETAAALQQITETVRKTSQGAQHAHQLIGEAKAKAEESGRVVRDAVAAMTNIEKSSGQMSQIIGVIDEIAFQTNLLALNAGVEAARAGEAGRGFAVVASEVRALAQRSAEAAKEIKTLILASSQQVEQGVDLVGRTGAVLEVIVRSVGEITHIVAEIAEGAKEQSSGLIEINTAVTQMDKNTQQNAAMVEESTAASHGLAKETDELAKIIEGFDVGSPKRSAASVVPMSTPARAASPAPAAPRKVVNARAAAPAESRDDWAEF